MAAAAVLAPAPEVDASGASGAHAGAQGSSDCFGVGVLSFDFCCLPAPRAECWDDFYTPQRCCTPVRHGCFNATLTYQRCCTAPQPGCWDDDFTPERCCGAQAPQARGEDAAGEGADPQALRGQARRARPAQPEPIATSAPHPQERLHGGGGRGNAECWLGALTYELCCLPQPNQLCWDDRYFTADRCCDPALPREQMTPLERLREELLTGVDPYRLLDYHPYQPEDRYPDSHLTPQLVEAVLGLVPGVTLWLEVGSFVGTSAITTAVTLKGLGMSTGIVCIDPFTGVVDMWTARKAMRSVHPLADSPLKMDAFGHSRIYETFLANIRHAGHQDVVMPLRVSSITGIKTLRQLKWDRRIDVLPQVIYLDSSHEQGETLLEVRHAWELLETPGVLFGDDWSWPGVRHDVTAFVRRLHLRNLTPAELRRFDIPSVPATQPVPGLALVPEGDGTWLLFKPA